MPRSPLKKLLGTTPHLWKGRRSNSGQRSLSTGHPRLDARLPGAGWPLGAITELISCKQGVGELSLLFPALAEMGRKGQWLILVDPPWIPYPAALHGHGLPLERLLLIRTRNEKESLWACEQALRGHRGGAMLAWPQRISFTRLRRLQLAAEEHAKLAFLFRPEPAAHTGSPAALRLQLQADHQRGTSVTVLKCRGHRPVEPVWIPYPGPARPGQDSLLQGAFPGNVSMTDFREPGSLLPAGPLPTPSPTIN
jgi:cell division inhibitor SulA/protein ImuA